MRWTGSCRSNNIQVKRKENITKCECSNSIQQSKSEQPTTRVVKLPTLWDIYASSAQVQMWKVETNQVNYTEICSPSVQRTVIPNKI